MTKPELISPAGDWISLRAAVEEGADAIYFGLKEFSMRAAAKNFELKELKKITDFCHKHKVKAYLALNTIIYETELKKITKILKAAKKAKIDALHAWDLSIISQAKKLKIPVHLSTQASVSNSEAANFYKKLGIKRIILARECSLKQIKEIKANSKIEIETFIHGAMCVSVSGRCFISQSLFNKSANRGECLQPCRREYIATDIDEKHKLRMGNNFILSPKDLCTINIIEQLIEAKIDAFKIEGRNRSPEYVKTVTAVYRTAIDFYKKNKNKKDFKKKFTALKKQLMQELKQVYNRGFSSGFFLGKPTEKDWTDKYGSKATKKKTYIGKILHFYSKIKVAEIKLEAGSLKLNDKIQIQGPTTGVIQQPLASIEYKHKKLKIAKKGKIIAVKLKSLARKNDQVFLIK